MSHKYTWLEIIAVTGALVICVIGFYQNYAFYHDDAFITLRYVYNFIHGNGIVWNPGEYVEGYTSFLHLFLISILGKLGVDLLWASRAVNGVAFFSLGIFVLVYFKRYDVTLSQSRTKIFQSIPFILTITTFPLIIWTLGGLEGPLFTFLCTVGILLFASCLHDSKTRNKQYTLSALFLTLACMTRPEGVIVSAVTFCFLIHVLVREGGCRLKSVLAFLLPFLCLYLPYFLWRVWYYGDLLPNAFYVKTTFFNIYRLKVGLRYIFAYFTLPPFLLVTLCFAVPYTIFKGAFTRQMFYLLTVLFTNLFFIAFVGGDHMQAFRFIVPLIPLAIVLLYWMLQPLLNGTNSIRAFVVFVVFLCVAGLQIRSDGVNPKSMDPAAFVGRLVGQYITNAWPRESLIALNTAGSTPYYAAHHRFIDMLGINDAHIAKRPITDYQVRLQRLPGHAKGDGAYVLARRPDFIIVGPSQGTIAKDPWFLSDLEIGQDPRFESHYELKQLGFDVREIKGYERNPITRSGMMRFTYYQRRHEEVH